MNKIAYIAPRKGGKTQFIIEKIQEESAKGNICYYLGGDKHYKEIVEKMRKQNCNIDLVFISKDVYPTDNRSAAFTDNLTWEMTSIYPYALRNMIKLDCNWYYTLPQEEVSNCAPEAE